MKRTAFTAALVIAAISIATVFAAAAFKGWGQAQIISVLPTGSGVQMSATATGYATQLGKFTRTETIVLDATGGFTGTVQFTSSNGDQLDAEITGAFTSQTQAGGTYTFTGGTGRFENASGTAIFVANLTDATHFDVSFNGSLNQ